MRKQSAPDALILAGERLFAEHGEDVSLRAIAVAADQRNNAAVAYHYGGRDGLITAIMARRIQGVEEYGRVALAHADMSSPADLIGVLVRSLVHAPRRQGSSHYARFLEVMRSTAKAWPADEGQSWFIATEALVDLAPGADESARRRRVSAMTTTMFALLADLEREPGTSASADEIVDMLAGLHQAFPGNV